MAVLVALRPFFLYFFILFQVIQVKIELIEIYEKTLKIGVFYKILYI